MEEDIKTQQILQSIMRRKNNSAIAIAFDKASSDDTSICRIAIAWISESKAHSMTYLVKPPVDDFSCSRKVTASMVAHSADFATVWDRQILPLLKGDVLALYDASRTLRTLKASYETSGRTFMLNYTSAISVSSPLPICPIWETIHLFLLSTACVSVPIWMMLPAGPGLVRAPSTGCR